MESRGLLEAARVPERKSRQKTKSVTWQKESKEGTIERRSSSEPIDEESGAMMEREWPSNENPDEEWRMRSKTAEEFKRESERKRKIAEEVARREGEREPWIERFSKLSFAVLMMVLVSAGDHTFAIAGSAVGRRFQ